MQISNLWEPLLKSSTRQAVSFKGPINLQIRTEDLHTNNVRKTHGCNPPNRICDLKTATTISLLKYFKTFAHALGFIDILLLSHFGIKNNVNQWFFSQIHYFKTGTFHKNDFGLFWLFWTSFIPVMTFWKMLSQWNAPSRERLKKLQHWRMCTIKPMQSWHLNLMIIRTIQHEYKIETKK